MLELKDTVDMMLSSDYKERMKAEYRQLKIRSDALKRMVENYYVLDFKPKCSLQLLQSQVASMCTYALILQERARIEGFDLI